MVRYIFLISRAQSDRNETNLYENCKKIRYDYGRINNSWLRIQALAHILDTFVGTDYTATVFYC